MRTGIRSLNWLRVIAAIMDAVILYACTYLALRIKFSDSPVLVSAQNIRDIENVLPLICVTGVLLLYLYGMYSMPFKTILDIIYTVGIVVLMLSVITMALSFLLRSFAFPRMIIGISSILQLVLIIIWHIGIYIVNQALHGKQTVLIVGHNPEIQDIAKKILLSPGYLYEVKYLFDISRDFKLVRKLIHNVDHVFLCPHITHKERQKVFSYCIAENASLYMVPELFDISVKNAQLQPFDDMPAFRIGQLKLTTEQRFVKRVFDIVFSLLIIILTSPLIMLSAILIKLTSPGKIFYKQERITENNKIFNVIKLRTMREGAEDLTGPVLATEKDPRVTRLGELLRATRLDELPQFYNVLLGDMSVVGPRPERPFFIEQFKSEIPDYEYRAAVKAGITGYAQVMGKYTTSYSDKLRYDLLYIKNYSFWLDITLIIRTIGVLFTKNASKGLSKEDTLKDMLGKMGYRLDGRDGYWEVGKIPINLPEPSKKFIFFC